MKKYVVIALCLLTVSTFAQTNVTVDLSKLDAQTAKTILDQLQKEKENTVTPDRIQEWTIAAQGIGTAVKEVCSSINVESNEFIKTPVGMFIAALLAWKILGASLLTKLVTIMMWCVIIPTVYYNFRRLHLGKEMKKTLKDGTVEYYTEKPVWEENDYAAFSGVAHLLVAVVTTIVTWVLLCQ